MTIAEQAAEALTRRVRELAEKTGITCAAAAEIIGNRTPAQTIPKAANPPQETKDTTKK